MDKEREIRFLYPPFMLIISLLVGLYFDHKKSIVDLIPQLSKSDKISELIILLIGGSIFILVLGFIIGIISVNILRLIFFVIKKRNFAPVDSLKNEAYNRISEILLPENIKITVKQRFYAGVSYDFTIIPKRVHEWLVRRWNSFNVSINSFVALLISILLAFVFDINISLEWIIFILVIGFFLIMNGIYSWFETLRMLEFQVNCDHDKIEKYKDK